MDVQALINLAQTKAEEVYDNATWITLINACLDDLTPVARLLKEASIPNIAVTNGAASIPFTNAVLARSHEILSVFFTPTQAGATPIAGASAQQMRRLGISDLFSAGWRLTTDALLLNNIPPHGALAVTEGTVIVHYYKMLDHVTSLASVPEIAPQYHSLIALYMCAKSQQKEEELNDKNDFYMEYLRGKNSMALDRIWDAEPHSRKFIHRTRIAAHIGAAPGR